MTKPEIERIARELMKEHGVEHFDFEWRRFKTSFGRCEKRLTPWATTETRGRIALSELLMPQLEKADVVDVILHEIAHALAPIDAGHDWRWKAVAMRIGAVPEKSQDRGVTPVEGRYQAKCSCGHGHQKYRRPQKWSVYRCKKTGDVLEFTDTKTK